MKNPSLQPRASLTDNGDGTYTFDDGLGNQTVITAGGGAGNTSVMTLTTNPDGTVSVTHDDGTGTVQSFCTGGVLTDEDGRTTTLDCGGQTLGRTLHVASPAHTTGTIDVSHADSDQTDTGAVTTTHTRVVQGSTNSQASAGNAGAYSCTNSVASNVNAVTVGADNGQNSGRASIVTGGSGVNTGRASIVSGDGCTNTGNRGFVGGLNSENNASFALAWGEQVTNNQRANAVFGTGGEANGPRQLLHGEGGLTTGAAFNAFLGGEMNESRAKNTITHGLNNLCAGGGLNSRTTGENSYTNGSWSDNHGYEVTTNTGFNYGYGRGTNTTGSYIWGFGTQANPAVVTQPNTHVTNGVDHGIGVLAPAVALDVDGTVMATSGFVVSDEQKKKNLKNLKTKGDFMAVRPKQYAFKKEADPETGKAHEGLTHFGFSAQEIQAQYPEAVRERVTPPQAVYEEKTVTRAVVEYVYDEAGELQVGEQGQPVGKVKTVKYNTRVATGEMTAPVPTGELYVEPLALIAILWGEVQQLRAGQKGS